MKERPVDLIYRTKRGSGKIKNMLTNKDLDALPHPDSLINEYSRIEIVELYKNCENFIQPNFFIEFRT